MNLAIHDPRADSSLQRFGRIQTHSARGMLGSRERDESPESDDPEAPEPLLPAADQSLGEWEAGRSPKALTVLAHMFSQGLAWFQKTLYIFHHRL